MIEDEYEQYQNFAETQHMLKNNEQGRVSSGGCPEINWQLNLRGGSSGKPDKAWGRYFTRPNQAFSSTPSSTIRDTALKMDRWPGCEGTAGNTWEHLINDRSHGHKSRNQIRWETTLRESETMKELGSRISDNRSDGCVAEMLGKKKWTKAFPVPNEMAKPYPQGGDPKLHVIQPSLGEPDEASLKLRKNRHPRQTAVE